MGEMNYGKLETSELLQKTLEALQRRGVQSTDAIRRVTGSMAVHSDIAALRKNGLEITTHYLGKRRGRRRFGYELVGGGQ